jgi:hypothetical protein
MALAAKRSSSARISDANQEPISLKARFLDPQHAEHRSDLSEDDRERYYTSFALSDAPGVPIDRQRPYYNKRFRAKDADDAEENALWPTSRTRIKLI